MNSLFVLVRGLETLPELNPLQAGPRVYIGAQGHTTYAQSVTPNPSGQPTRTFTQSETQLNENDLPVPAVVIYDCDERRVRCLGRRSPLTETEYIVEFRHETVMVLREFTDRALAALRNGAGNNGRGRMTHFERLDLDRIVFGAKGYTEEIRITMSR